MGMLHVGREDLCDRTLSIDAEDHFSFSTKRRHPEAAISLENQRCNLAKIFTKLFRDITSTSALSALLLPG